jgi:hypothetical protein
MALPLTIWSGWVSGHLIGRSFVVAHIWFSEYVDEKPVKVEARPPRGGASRLCKKKIFFLLTKKTGATNE